MHFVILQRIAEQPYRNGPLAESPGAEFARSLEVIKPRCVEELRTGVVGNGDGPYS